MSPQAPRRAKIPSRSRLTLLASLWGAALLLLGVAPSQTVAGTTISLHKSFAGNINYLTTGNTMRAAPNNTYAGGNSCALLSGNNGTSVDAGTSSSPLSGIPAGSTIVAAYLYYDGSGTVPWSNVTFDGNALTADTTWTDTSNPAGFEFFGGFKDVTSYVTGNGTYSVGGISVDNTDNINAYCTTSTVMAGWALVVIYSNPSEANRVINIFDGFEPFQGSSITLTPNNFKVPTSPINGKFTDITWEGDPDINSNNGANTLTETLEFNGNVLSDACNPTADFSLPNGSNGGVFVAGNPNQYNSTINTLSCTGNLTPTGDEQYFGVDVDTFDISSTLTAGETSATTFYSSGQDMVFLTAQVVSVTNTPVADLSMTKVHNGTFGYGDNGTYTLTVKNNGPATETGTITVTDTLPTGLTYVSAAGTGWSCGFTSPTLTCTDANSGGLANGASLPAITLTATVQTGAPASISNTATVSGQLFDNNSANNSSTDTVAPVNPDLSTSTKDVANTGGGDAVVGSTLQYTITLTEGAGVAASGVSVTDDVPANLSGFTVTSYPAGSTNSSTGAGTGANNDGFVDITGITVPASGSVTVVFTAQVAAGTANCTDINNSGTINNPNGSTTSYTVTAATVEVAQSSCAASGNKILYVYDNTVGQTYTNLLNRIPQTVNTSGTGAITVARGANHTWNMSPVVATGRPLTLTAGNVTVSLIVTNTGAATGTRRPTTVTLLNNGAPVATSGTVNSANNNRPTLLRYTLTIPSTTVLSGNALNLQFNNNSPTNNHSVTVSQKTATIATTSQMSFATSTVINVDSVTAYNGNYTGTGTPLTLPVFQPSETGHTTTVYLCAVISDPFGSYDVDPATGGTAPQITITDPNGAVQVNAASMTLNGGGGKDCSGTANSAANSYEYAYTLPIGGATGFWTAQVTGHEGTEGTISQASNGSFDVDVPNLLVMKTVSVVSDPVEGSTRPKAIPGATVLYTVQVQNNGRGYADAGNLVITDPTPTNTVFDLTGATPFTFTDGGTASGLSAPVMTFSNNGGTSYVYSPICTRPCTDPAITNFKITFTGSMNGKTGASAPSFTVTFTVVLQ